MEHAKNIDFVNEGEGLGARLAVELSERTARSLVEMILAVLDRAEAGGRIIHRCLWLEVRKMGRSHGILVCHDRA